MNVRIYDQGVDTVVALETALRGGSIAGGTLANSAWMAMIDVSNLFSTPTISFQIMGANEALRGKLLSPTSRNHSIAKLSRCSKI